MKKLNFGCGNDILDGWDNFDESDFNFNKFPYLIEDNPYDYIFIQSVLDYLDSPYMVLKELKRICKKCNYRNLVWLLEL